MNLVIDIGNSKTKVAIFEDGKVIRSFTFDIFDSNELDKLYRDFSVPDAAILSSVSNGKKSSELCKVLGNRIPKFIELGYNTPLPIDNMYGSKQTIGVDRLAVVSGASLLFPGCNLLVIDAGTAITFDIIDKDERFWGGNISPGIELRFKALNTFTSQLPYVKKMSKWKRLGTTTEEAILAGVLNGIIFEVDSMINNMRLEWPKLKVVITGGDATFFDKKLKNIIFVETDAAFFGLNRILEYNVK